MWRKGKNQRCSIITQHERIWHVPISKTHRTVLFGFDSVNWMPFNMLPWLLRLKLEVFEWKMSTGLWIACECVPEHLPNAHLPPFFFLWLPLPPTPIPPLHRSLSAILSHHFLISFDHCQLIRGQHLGGHYGNRQDQIFSALKGRLRFAEGGGGGQWQISPGLTDGAEQNRSPDDCWCVFARMWVCMCYLISPESTAHPVGPV